MLHTTPLAAAREYHSKPPAIKIKPSEINGITAVGKNLLRYGAGTVRFEDNVPIPVRKQFFRNGTGHLLKKYNTNVLYDTQNKVVSIVSEKIPSIFKVIKTLLSGEYKPDLKQTTFLYNGREAGKMCKNMLNFFTKLKR